MFCFIFEASNRILTIIQHSKRIERKKLVFNAYFRQSDQEVWGPHNDKYRLLECPIKEPLNLLLLKGISNSYFKFFNRLYLYFRHPTQANFNFNFFIVSPLRPPDFQIPLLGFIHKWFALISRQVNTWFQTKQGLI